MNGAVSNGVPTFYRAMHGQVRCIYTREAPLVSLITPIQSPHFRQSPYQSSRASLAFSANLQPAHFIEASRYHVIGNMLNGAEQHELRNMSAVERSNTAGTASSGWSQATAVTTNDAHLQDADTANASADSPRSSQDTVAVVSVHDLQVLAEDPNTHLEGLYSIPATIMGRPDVSTTMPDLERHDDSEAARDRYLAHMRRMDNLRFVAGATTTLTLTGLAIWGMHTLATAPNWRAAEAFDLVKDGGGRGFRCNVDADWKAREVYAGDDKDGVYYLKGVYCVADKDDGTAEKAERAVLTVARSLRPQDGEDAAETATGQSTDVPASEQE